MAGPPGRNDPDGSPRCRCTRRGHRTAARVRRSGEHRFACADAARSSPRLDRVVALLSALQAFLKRPIRSFSRPPRRGGKRRKEPEMIRAGDSIENPVTGERLVFRQTSNETGGEAVVIETYVQPGGFVAAAHVHPVQEERFQVLRGTVGFKVGGRKLVAGPGHRLTV